MATYRALPSGITLSDRDAAIIKGMMARGDRQHDIAAWFGVNGGRVGEIASGRKFPEVLPAPQEYLPPAGPYLSGRDTAVLFSVLAEMRGLIEKVESFVKHQNY